MFQVLSSGQNPGSRCARFCAGVNGLGVDTEIAKFIFNGVVNAAGVKFMYESDLQFLDVRWELSKELYRRPSSRSIILVSFSLM